MQLLESATGSVWIYNAIRVGTRHSKTYIYAWILIKQTRIHDIDFYEDPIFLPKASAATKIWTAVSQQISSRPVWAKVVNTW